MKSIVLIRTATALLSAFAAIGLAPTGCRSDGGATQPTAGAPRASAHQAENDDSTSNETGEVTDSADPEPNSQEMPATVNSNGENVEADSERSGSPSMLVAGALAETFKATLPKLVDRALDRWDRAESAPAPIGEGTDPPPTTTPRESASETGGGAPHAPVDGLSGPRNVPNWPRRAQNGTARLTAKVDRARSTSQKVRSNARRAVSESADRRSPIEQQGPSAIQPPQIRTRVPTTQSVQRAAGPSFRQR